MVDCRPTRLTETKFSFIASVLIIECRTFTPQDKSPQTTPPDNKPRTSPPPISRRTSPPDNSSPANNLCESWNHSFSKLVGHAHPQSALEFCPIHCPNGRLGQDLGFGGIAFALKLPELLNTNLAAVRAKLGQTSCFPNGPHYFIGNPNLLPYWCPIGQ